MTGGKWKWSWPDLRNLPSIYLLTCQCILIKTPNIKFKYKNSLSGSCYISYMRTDMVKLVVPFLLCFDDRDVAGQQLKSSEVLKKAL
jgi:hypothetical protein